MSEEKNTRSSEKQSSPEMARGSKIPNVTLLNIVLLVGLLVLYALQFYPDSTQPLPQTEETAAEVAGMADIIADGAFNIAFVHSDSLMENYRLAIRMREEFDAEQRRLENQLSRRQRNFQEEVESFQSRAQLGLLSREEAQVKEQELMLEQQEIMQLNEDFSSRLMRKEMEMNQELYQRITDLLERFNQQMGYDYILGFSPGGGILYAKQRHDITHEIIRRLNEEYDASQE